MSKKIEVGPPEFRLGYMPSLRDTDIDFGEEVSLTQQHMAQECDINNIMAQYEKTGILTHVARHQGDYTDLQGPLTFHEAMNQVIAGTEAFNSLPAHVRARFANDPGQFLDFVHNPDNMQGMIDLGLLPPDMAVQRAQNAGETDMSETPKASKKPSKASSPPVEEGD